MKVKELPSEWRTWLEEEVYPLIDRQQRRAFLQLETDAQRHAFVDRLWILWGRQTGFGSAFRRMYDERLEMARLEFGSTLDARARVLLLHGLPPLRMVVKCTEVFNPMEIWGWPYLEGIGEGPVVVFYQKGSLGRWQMWEGHDGWTDLYTTLGTASVAAGPTRPNDPLSRPEYRCMDGDTIVRLIRTAEMWTRDPRFIFRMYQYRPQEQTEAAESAPNRFMEFSAIADDDRVPIDVAVGDESRAMRGGLVDVGFDITLPAGDLGTTPVGDLDVVQLDLIGEISRGEEMVDRFRYLYSVPAAGDRIGLDLERWIRPGDYLLRLKVEDAHSPHEAIVEHRFTARVVDGVIDDDTDELAALMLGLPPDDPEERPVLTLLGPPGETVSGVRRFEAVTRPEVQRVAFLLDDEEVLTKNRPPFDIDLNLGPLPKLTRVTAIAYDADGAELARDGLTLNVGRERFFLRILPRGPDDARGDQVRVAVDVNVPSEREIVSLEIFWNDEMVASLDSPPYEAWVRIDRTARFGLLRAVAVLDDESVAEDIQFVNAPEFGSVIDVTGVELPVTVLDRSGQPVRNLEIGDFRVFEDGVEQTITHVGEHVDLPVRLGIVIDTSGSMAPTLPTVQRVVMGFLRDLLRPRDRAFIEVFSDRPDLLATFTADFGTLEHALLALYPDRATALYDSVITGLFQFSGVSGRRAMVLLTDGEDTASKNGFDDALAYAQRMGVTIYTIGVDLPTTKVVTRFQLKRLSSATGGRAFFVGRDSKLDAIYDEIDRELRSQYLLGYTSSSNKPAGELRKVEVEVEADQRVKVRTITGYYPGGA
ncbi:MAG: VWA domain-containing protein [Holophagae bacterium]|jgi:VWFA-related protein